MASAPRLIIAVAARKGGVGKTTVSAALASILAARKMNVLVVDLDPQSNAGFFLGTNPAAPGTAEMLLGEPFEPLATEQPRLMVVPGGLRLQDRQIQMLDPADLADAIKRLSGFDAIVMDCPPGHENLERLAMRAANVGLGIANAHPVAFAGLGQVIADIEHARENSRPVPRKFGIVLNQLDRRRSMDRDAAGQVSKAFPCEKTFIVRQDACLAKITADRRPLMQAPSSERGVSLDDLKLIAEWILA